MIGRTILLETSKWSIQNQGFWVEKGARSFNDSDGNYDNSSRIEPKRSHRWFIDGGPNEGLFPNKRQAVGVPTTNLFTGLLNSNVCDWGSFHLSSGPFGERLFDSQTSRHVDVGGASFVSLDKVYATRKVEDNLLGNDLSSSLSMSHTLEGTECGLNYGGIKKVKVSQVKESEETMPGSLEPGYVKVDNNRMSISLAYDKIESNGMSMGLAYNNENGGSMTTGETNGNIHGNLLSIGQPYGRLNENLPIFLPNEEDKTTIDVMHSFRKGNAFSMVSQSISRMDEKNMAMGHIYDECDGSTNLSGQNFNSSVDGNFFMGQSHRKGESTIISFGGYTDETNPSGRLLANYELFASNPPFQLSEVNNEKELVYSNGALLLSNESIASGRMNSSKKNDELKSSKKASANSFPSNVRSLLSTGMFDGVPVKYIAWSREKQLRGVIKGTGYLCGCPTCNFSKVVNAYEFERHANCKTKHPNNHIYCENGKTIYGIVLELRSTPQNMLFEVMQTITGSPINQKSFQAWRDSFCSGDT